MQPAPQPDPAAPVPPVPVRANRLPESRLLADRLLETLGGLDLASADGRAGIRTLLAEIERLSPGAILQQAASIELRRVGWLCGQGRVKIS
ncbi:hypothetical protein GGQ87_000750 [Brevundimonas alba]|uniref:Uncharacterized protein n=1 Tax=Brevundimonas alba TaxID=74314 RepID=A0A7X6BML6_9CAUL|nr:hypothetical protein [Brevundimonas alba]NJC40492.1 hypothetical protein [Brevundimonas alba]